MVTLAACRGDISIPKNNETEMDGHPVMVIQLAKIPLEMNVLHWFRHLNVQTNKSRKKRGLPKISLTTS